MKKSLFNGLFLLGILTCTTSFADNFYSWNKSFFLFKRNVWHKAHHYTAKDLLRDLEIYDEMQLRKLWGKDASKFNQLVQSSNKVPEEVKKRINLLYKKGKLYKIYPLFARLVNGFIPVGCH